MGTTPDQLKSEIDQTRDELSNNVNALADKVSPARITRRRLQAVKDGWDGSKPSLDDALLYNRKLWTIFLTSVTSAENPLPVEIRQNVANLGLFVMKPTLSIMASPRPEPLGSLININRELASGLTGRA